jgi:hypothetical protein
MIVKKTKQLGNFKRGINLYVPRRSSSAPSGIPVASTNTINVVDTFSIGQTISLSKINSTEYRTESSPLELYVGGEYCYEQENFTDVRLYRVSVILEGGIWYYRYFTYWACGDGNPYPTDSSNQLSVTQVASGIIPITGWLRNGNPYSFTITAA